MNMTKDLSLKGAIEELQRVFKLLNKRYFNNSLEMPVIALNTNTTSGAYGWITVNKVWSSKDGKHFHEINLCAEHLHRDTELVISTLLHEMCHLYNIQNKIQDVSRSGKYHNTKFRDTAETHGLVVEKSEKYGYSTTKPTQELTGWVKENVRSECFELARMKAPKGEKTPKQSMRKYVCMECGLIVRASKDITGKVKCVDCDEVLIEN